MIHNVSSRPWSSALYSLTGRSAHPTHTSQAGYEPHQLCTQWKLYKHRQDCVFHFLFLKLVETLTDSNVGAKRLAPELEKHALKYTWFLINSTYFFDKICLRLMTTCNIELRKVAVNHPCVGGFNVSHKASNTNGKSLSMGFPYTYKLNSSDHWLYSSKISSSEKKTTVVN